MGVVVIPGDDKGNNVVIMIIIMDFWWCLFNWYFLKCRHLSSEEISILCIPNCPLVLHPPLFLTLSSLETTFSFFCWTFPLFRLRHDSIVCSLDKAGNAPYWQQGSSRVSTPPLPRSKNVFPPMVSTKVSYYPQHFSSF